MRAGNAVTPELEQEMASLRLRVRELEGQLRDQRAASSGAVTVDLSHGDEVYDIRSRLKYWNAEDVKKGKDTEYRATPRSVWLNVPATWNEIFAEIASRMLIEASTEELEEGLQATAIDTFNREELNPADYQKGVSLKPSDDAKRDVILQLSALGLIQESERRHQISDKNQYWQLTPEGRAHLTRLRAVRVTDDAKELAADAAPSPRATKTATVKKAPAKKATAKKATAKKATAKKAAKGAGTRKTA